MSPPIDPLVKITPERETWRVKVRVIRLWYLPSFNNPRALNSIEMVFMDEFGCKIHASVRKTLVYKFKPLLSEGQVYIFAYFGVGENSGFFRTTKHEFRLNFQIRTTVRPSESEIIPLHGLSLTPFEDILQPNGEPAYLVDIIGLLTAVGTEREYDKEGKKTKMIVIELDAESIKIECALFGSYVDELTSFIASGDMSQPVLVVQFAKIKTFKGKNVLQNVMFATRILFNPDIPEVSDFKKKLPQLNDDVSQTLSHLSDIPIYSLEDDFLRLTPRKSIEQLKDCKEDGFCILLATVKHIIKGADWWYTACKCNKAVTPDSGMYYCDSCYCHVVNVVPRYRIKLRVIDDTDSATFVMFDRDACFLLKKTCSEMVEQFQKIGQELNYPPDFDNWIEKSFLFKVEVKSTSFTQFEPSFRVKRVCTDASVIKQFKDTESAGSPKEAVFTAGLSVSDVNVSSELPDVDSSIAKDLMSQFCDSEMCVQSDMGNTPPATCPAKRSFEEGAGLPIDDLSSTKLKAVKIEKD